MAMCPRVWRNMLSVSTSLSSCHTTEGLQTKSSMKLRTGVARAEFIVPLPDPVYKVVGIITLEDITGGRRRGERRGPAPLQRHWRTSSASSCCCCCCTPRWSDDVLSPDDVRGIVAHLSANVSQIDHLFSESAAGLTELV
jgi:hypothetical protein